MSNEDTISPKSRSISLRKIADKTPSFLAKNRTIIAVLAFLYLLPLGTTAGTSPVRAVLFILTQIMIFGLLAMSFDLQLGRASLLNFGHVALFGVGAYFIAFSLDITHLPPPFNLVALIPYPFTIIIAMMIGGFLGLIMGLTTSRMRGTAFAFIALAIAEFIYNFFAENPDISGGETGLGVATPALIRTGPFYLLFVIITFAILAAFIGMVILYLKKRTDLFGLVLVTPVLVALSAVLFVYGTNIIGPIVVSIAFGAMVLYYFMERRRTLTNPLHYSEETSDQNPSTKNAFVIPLIIVSIVIIGIAITFGANIIEMFSLWVEGRTTIFYQIPVQYYLVLSCLVMVYFLTRRIIASPFGRMMTAVAQNEERAEALGYNSYHAKIVVLIISGAIASLAGALYAPYIRTIDPETALGVGLTIDAMLYTIIGGLGTLFGPLLGAGVIKYSELNLVDIITGFGLDGRMWLVVLGVIYIIIVLFLPLGIVGSIARRSGSIKQKLRRIKIRSFEFGLRDEDYWTLGLLGAMSLFLFIIEDSRFLFISLGIFGLLTFVGLYLLYSYRSEIASEFRSLPSRLTKGG